MPFIKKAKNTHFIETVLKKSGIINKHSMIIHNVYMIKIYQFKIFIKLV